MQIVIVFYNCLQYNIDITFPIKASEECDKGENVLVTGDADASCLRSRLLNLLSNVTYSPIHRQAGTPLIKI
jgi:hypothetical protein